MTTVWQSRVKYLVDLGNGVAQHRDGVCGGVRVFARDRWWVV